GVMLFELLTGDLPCPETHLAELREWVLSERPVPSVRERCPGLPEEVDRLVASLLTRAPARRLSSAVELRERLRQLEEDLTPWRDEPGHAGPQRRQVTLVVCWLTELKGLAEHLDAEDLGELEGAFHQACSDILVRHGGFITLCMGDEVIACFGYPQATEHDAEMAARAALHLTEYLGDAIQQRMSAPFAFDLSVKVGLHTDTVMMDPPSSRGQGGPGAFQGEAPTIAVWLSRRAEPDSVYLSAPAWRLVKGAFLAEPRGTHSFQGLSGEVTGVLYRLTREKRPTNRFARAHETEGLSPLVGRRDELRSLLAYWERARQGPGTFVLLQGEAGIGKSRLLQELQAHVPANGVVRLHLQCWAQFSGSALRPLIELLLNEWRLSPKGNPRANLRRLEGRLGALGLSGEHVRVLASLLSLPIAEESLLSRPAPERQKEKTFEALLALLQRVAEEQAVFAIVEDLHWADPSTLEWLNFLLARGVPDQVCIMLTARSDFRGAWPAVSALQTLVLDRLSPRLTAQLVRSSVPGTSLSEETVQQLVARTDGVPLFAEELTRMVVERASPAEPSFIPMTLSGLLLERLDMLSRSQKALAQLCAVVGRGFSHALLTLLSGRSEALLQRELEGLLRANVLRRIEDSNGTRYQFRHALIQDAAYQSLLRRTRREYHRRIAHTLAAQAPDLENTQPELLARHYTEAGEVAPALRLWAKAGERASLRSANVEAIQHLGEALRLLRTLPETPERAEQELRLQVALGMPLMQTRSLRSHEVARTYTRVMALFHQVGDALEVFPSTWGTYAYAFARAKFPLAQELAELTVRWGEDRHHREMLALGHRMLATNHFTWGHMPVALAHIVSALDFSDFELEQHRALAVKQWVNPRVAALAYGSVVHSVMGHDEQARQDGRSAVRLAERIGHPHSLAFALTYVSLSCQLRRDSECTGEMVARCIALSSEHHFRIWLGWSVFIQSWVLAERGRVREGLETLRANLKRWRRAGMRAGMPLFLGMLAELHLKLGEFPQGLTAVSHALGWANAVGEHSYEVELHRIRGELLRALGREGDAVAAFSLALDVARRQGSEGFGRRVLWSARSSPWRGEAARHEAEGGTP
ncbi:MAG: AAA family ATPase, partial [Cystobacter sp.]